MKAGMHPLSLVQTVLSEVRGPGTIGRQKLDFKIREIDGSLFWLQQFDEFFYTKRTHLMTGNGSYVYLMKLELTS